MVARLLATDAALKIGEDVFPTSDWIIPPGNSRKRALELLDQWQRDLQLLSKLETLAGKADALLNLQPMMAESSWTVSDWYVEQGWRVDAEGQTSPVASVEPCMAPAPTTTELGMAYVLPGLTKSL